MNRSFALFTIVVTAIAAFSEWFYYALMHLRLSVMWVALFSIPVGYFIAAIANALDDMAMAAFSREDLKQFFPLYPIVVATAVTIGYTIWFYFIKLEITFGLAAFTRIFEIFIAGSIIGYFITCWLLMLKAIFGKLPRKRSVSRKEFLTHDSK